MSAAKAFRHKRSPGGKLLLWTSNEKKTTVQRSTERTEDRSWNILAIFFFLWAEIPSRNIYFFPTAAEKKSKV